MPTLQVALQPRPVVLTLFAIITDGLVYAAYLFLVAVGLTLIFGVMKILNVTHGSFYAFGAYGAATTVGIYYDRGLPDAGGFLLMLLVAIGIGFILGLVLERGILRLVYGRDEVIVVLVTYAAFLILEDVIVLIWGPQSYAAYQPMVAAGSVEVGELVLSNYDILLVLLAYRRNLRSRDRGCIWHQRDGRVHRHLRDRRHPGHDRRCGDGTENFRDARNRRGSDRARVRSGGDRRHGLS
jgi:ABC-type branched-subunit amino acid transport system permease subunit